jgi:hypothetical protein
MSDASAKQEIVEKIKESSNILVTVSRDPSVDELSAALGLTVMLNKMKKHATAVFSGAIPPAITFLDPEKTFESTVDSLRDFIIALDKEKADHLRYKVDGDVVKIFITPYRTTITSDDLEFSQGDYNVELVVGLGVKNQDDLDEALAAHGRILHDATVVTLSVGEEDSQLGSTDWHEPNASSLSEMLVMLSDSLKSDKPLLDEQIASAYLTGIVAATDRFSNGLTSSKAMTIAGQLMTAGANQQLIASKLEEAHEIGAASGVSNDNGNSDGTTDLAEGESTKLSREKPAKKKDAKKQKEADDGSLNISHEKEGDVDEVASATQNEEQLAAKDRAEEEIAKQTTKVPAQQQSEAARTAEQNLAQQLSKVAPAAGATPSLADLQKDIANANEEVSEAATQPPASPAAVSELSPKEPEPSFGGTLNATTEQAAEDKRHELANTQNHTILTHGGNSYVGDSTPTFQSPLNAASQSEYEPNASDPFSASPAFIPEPAPTPVAAAPIPPPPEPTPIAEPEPAISYAPPTQPPNETLADLDAKTRGSHDEARAAIDAAFGAQPQTPPIVTQDNPAPVSAPALPPLPPMPDFSTLPPLPPAPDGAAPVGDIAPMQPSGALPPEKLEEVLGAAPATPAPTPQSDDPGQFRIPGQS